MSDNVAREPDEREIRRLTVDLDVEVCVVGGGLAGLSVALEAARMGASVALLEARRLGWGASGQHLGTVSAGFDVAADAIIARIGRRAAGELWRMSRTGAEMVRTWATPMPDIALAEGALVVSSSRLGDRALEAMQALGTDFGLDCEPFDTTRLRDLLRTRQYFRGLSDRNAFSIDGSAYLDGLAGLARQAGVRIYEETPAVALDVSGNRKRVTTPLALLRAGHVILAGNVHLGATLPRLTATLLPIWRYGVVTAPLGEHLANTMAFPSAVADTDGIDHFRVVSGDRLMWSSPETTWEAGPQRLAVALQRRIRRVFPSLGPVSIAATFGGPVGRTVHGMPQIGQLRPGLWVSSGFGLRGLATTAMAGRIIAEAILYGDDRWRQFGAFDLIWAGGRLGRVAGYGIGWAARRRAAIAGALARRREAIADQRKLREARVAAGRQLAPPANSAQLASQQSDQEPAQPV